jgi:heme exporter protein C
MKKLAVPLFCVLGAVGFVVSIYLIFMSAGLEYATDELTGRLAGSSLFFNQKIFYFHVAHAIVLFTSVFVAGIYSILFLWKRNPKFDDVASASVDVAVAFGAAVLATGSIWAKAAWDVWWNWEPRLTMSLLLWLILVGYVLVRRFAGPSADRVAAGMAIFGMVGVPFIYTMVGADSHPNSGLNGTVFTLGARLVPPFLASMITFFLWFAALVIARVQSTRDEREVRELREQGLDLGVLQ